METLVAAVCEDEPRLAQDLRRRTLEYLTACGRTAQTLAFPDGESLLAAPVQADIVLMDLNLPGMHGLETVRRLRMRRPDCQIIFVTAYPEYALQAFQIDAVHYLLKPVTNAALAQALERALCRLTRRKKKTLAVTRGAQTVVLPLDDVLYCEVLSHRVFVHTETGSFDYTGTLEELEHRLDHRFFRCHKSFLVNLQQVAGRYGDAAVLTDGGQVPVARRRQAEFARRLLETVREELE